MKKLISLLLALLMIFSVVTVAFAEDDNTQTPATVDAQDEGADGETKDTAETKDDAEKKDDTDAKDTVNELLDAVKDTPASSAKTMVKLGKIVLKFVKIFVKFAVKFGWINTDDVVKTVADLFGLDPDTELPTGTANTLATLF